MPAVLLCTSGDGAQPTHGIAPLATAVPVTQPWSTLQPHKRRNSWRFKRSEIGRDCMYFGTTFTAPSAT